MIIQPTQLYVGVVPALLTFTFGFYHCPKRSLGAVVLYPGGRAAGPGCRNESKTLFYWSVKNVLKNTTLVCS